MFKQVLRFFAASSNKIFQHFGWYKGAIISTLMDCGVSQCFFVTQQMRANMQPNIVRLKKTTLNPDPAKIQSYLDIHHRIFCSKISYRFFHAVFQISVALINTWPVPM